MPKTPLERVWRFKPQNSVNMISKQENFYSGQDCYVFAVPRNKKFVPLPVTGFAFGMSQEKVPIFGAWSYTWDAVANGTRMVQGQFSIIFVEPNHMGRLLGPDDVQTKANPNNPVEIIDENNELKRRTDLRSNIWGVQEGRSPYETMTSPHLASRPIVTGDVVYSKREAFPFGRSIKNGTPEALYSGHPSFDLMVAFGSNPDLHQSQIGSEFDYRSWMARANDIGKLYSTVNDSLMFNPGHSERIYFEDVQLLSCGITADTSGQPLVETYTFMARDATTPYVT